MLSQRIVKAYLMIGAGIEIESAKKELDNSVALFEQQFLELEEFAPNTEIKIGLGKVERLWSKFRLISVDEPNKLDGIILMVRSDELLEACDNVVTMLENYSQKHSSRLVNISGRQRMLSQRIAMLYFAYFWGFPENDIIKIDIVENFNESVNVYKKSIRKLIKSNKNTEEISDGLNIVQSYWIIPNKSLGEFNKEELAPGQLFESTNKILSEMDRITGLYEYLQDN